MTNPRSSAQELIDAARRLYLFRDEIHTSLDALEERLGQPLRVAIVGSVKAGKSTLLNGLLGERIAPTDSRECTRIVTWYHQGAVPRVRGHLASGDVVTLPAKRQSDRLELELGGLTSDDFERLDVTWPAPGLSGITLIDTPGTVSASHTVSAQTDRFLLPDEGATGADAVIYLLRALHETDVAYLRSLHERTRHGNAAIGSIAVLSRADELGSGRLTAMAPINETAERLRNSPELEGICETIVPVAGLMGMGAMGLRQADFAVFKNLAELPHTETEQLLITAERFITAKDASLPAERVRVDLVDRFGMYGIRLALAAVRGGIDDAGELAVELLRRSGLDELRRVIDVHFTQRQAELKAHSVVLALHQLLRTHPVQGSAELLAAADRHMENAHTFAEMRLVGRIASGRLNLPEELGAELERLAGGRGSSPATRLGLTGEGIEFDRLLQEATTQLQRWRDKLGNPLLDRETREACAIAERTCEALIVGLLDPATSHRLAEAPAT